MPGDKRPGASEAEAERMVGGEPSKVRSLGAFLIVLSSVVAGLISAALRKQASWGAVGVASCP